jgi:putative ABC transport system permease protein
MHAYGGSYGKEIPSEITIPTSSMLEKDEYGMFRHQNLTENLIDEIKKDKRIEKVVGTYYTSWSINKTQGMGIIGFNSQDADLMKIHLSEGRMFDDNKKEMILSDRDAKMLNKTIGENLLFSNDSYEVVGITTFKSRSDSYTSVGNVEEIAKLHLIQNEKYGGGLDQTSGKLKNIYIKVKEDENASQITEDLKKKFYDSNLIVEGPNEREIAENRYYHDLSRIIYDLIPVFIGVVLTLIIMLKAIGDRTREIGVLKAIGWKSRRIFIMILSEAFILTLISFIIASILVILITFEMNNMMPDYAVSFLIYLDTLSVVAFLKAFYIVLIMALLGSLVPAIRASRLSPAEAVREE